MAQPDDGVIEATVRSSPDLRQIAPSARPAATLAQGEESGSRRIRQHGTIFTAVLAALDLRAFLHDAETPELEGEAMDEARTRDHINQHADAIARGDMDAIVADFAEDLRPQVPQIAQDLLPQPVTAAEVLSVDVGDSETVAMIRYSGGTGEVTIRSRWQEQAGRPVIVNAEPAS
jgi:hypothetical protein